MKDFLLFFLDQLALGVEIISGTRCLNHSLNDMALDAKILVLSLFMTAFVVTMFLAAITVIATPSYSGPSRVSTGVFLLLMINITVFASNVFHRMRWPSAAGFLCLSYIGCGALVGHLFDFW